MRRARLAIGVFGVVVAAAACAPASDDASGTPTGIANSGGVTCVPLPEGTYLFENGVFVPASAPVANLAETVDTRVDGPPLPAERGVTDAALSARLSGEFPAMGYDWMELTIRRGAATLSGRAPDPPSKEAAFLAGQTAIFADPEAGDRVKVVIDAISVEGGRSGVGLALAGLGDTPSAAACQGAFTDTMTGRNVEFRFASDVILPESARLLDATAGVALLCDRYRVEIGGHTDAIGDDDENRALSQRRADAVRAYLVARGVNGDLLTAIGYGETQQIDTSGTREGNARNRRTEFTIKPR